jgi:energy-coupling factor transporter ATP-binding protein EcfA2
MRSERRTFGGDAPYNTLDYTSFKAELYFKNLDLPKSIQTYLMNRLDLHLEQLSVNVRNALSITDAHMKECKTLLTGTKVTNAKAKEPKWNKCSDACETLIVDASKQEAGSTAFMLKVLSDSIIRPDGRKHRLQIRLDESFRKDNKERLLTGQWKDDAPYLHLVLPDGAEKGRLIMGFGPSSSGKTHLAKTILTLLKQADQNFPEVFFSLDGGIIRESSATYQFAKEMARCKGWAGFTNLLGGPFRGDMFPSDDVKKIMELYLLKESETSSISLYVPETLGVCDWKIPKTSLSVPSPSCQKIIDRYVEVTKDTSWIGLLIWQHKYGRDHAKDLSFFENEECVGCTESGMDREKKEGKKYSNAAYDGSMEKGRHYLMMALGGQYEIHNCGIPGKISVMWDTSPRNAVTDAFSDIMRRSALGFGIRYVDERPVGARSAPTPPSGDASVSFTNTPLSNGEEGNASRHNGEEWNASRHNGEEGNTAREEAAARNAASAIARAAARNASEAERAAARYDVDATVNLRKSEHLTGAPMKFIESRPFYERGSRGNAPVNMRIPVSDPSVDLRKIVTHRSPVVSLSPNFEAAKQAAILTALRAGVKKRQNAHNQIAELTAKREKAARERAAAEAKRTATMMNNAAAAINSSRAPTSVISPEERRGMSKYSVFNDTGFLSRNNLGTIGDSSMVDKVTSLGG